MEDNTEEEEVLQHFSRFLQIFVNALQSRTHMSIRSHILDGINLRVHRHVNCFQTRKQWQQTLQNKKHQQNSKYELIIERKKTLLNFAYALVFFLFCFLLFLFVSMIHWEPAPRGQSKMPRWRSLRTRVPLSTETVSLRKKLKEKLFLREITPA